MSAREGRLSAEGFRDAEHAADHALDAAMIAHDVALVVSLVLQTEVGQLTLAGQEAVRTVAIYGVEKAREARNAIDVAAGMARAARGRT